MIEVLALVLDEALNYLFDLLSLLLLFLSDSLLLKFLFVEVRASTFCCSILSTRARMSLWVQLMNKKICKRHCFRVIVSLVEIMLESILCALVLKMRVKVIFIVAIKFQKDKNERRQSASKTLMWMKFMDSRTGACPCIWSSFICYTIERKKTYKIRHPSIFPFKQNHNKMTTSLTILKLRNYQRIRDGSKRCGKYTIKRGSDIYVCAINADADWIGTINGTVFHVCMRTRALCRT